MLGSQRCDQVCAPRMGMGAGVHRFEARRIPAGFGQRRWWSWALMIVRARVALV